MQQQFEALGDAMKKRPEMEMTDWKLPMTKDRKRKGGFEECEKRRVADEDEGYQRTRMRRSSGQRKRNGRRKVSIPWMMQMMKEGGRCRIARLVLLTRGWEEGGSWWGHWGTKALEQMTCFV